MKLDPYIDYCSQLIVTHINNSGILYDSTRGFKQSVLSVDIKDDPRSFMKQMMSVVTHMVLASVSLNNNKLLEAFDPAVQQNNIILRDIVFALLTVKELVKRIDNNNEEVLKTIADEMLVELSI